MDRSNWINILKFILNYKISTLKSLWFREVCGMQWSTEKNYEGKHKYRLRLGTRGIRGNTHKYGTKGIIVLTYKLKMIRPLIPLNICNFSLKRECLLFSCTLKFNLKYFLFNACVSRTQLNIFNNP